MHEKVWGDFLKKKEIISTVEEEELSEELEHRYRVYSFILYSDTTSYNFDDCVRQLKSLGQWAMIKHNPEKEEKKEHYHFILHMKNGKKKDRIHELTGVPLPHFKNVRSERMMLRYLIHLDDPDKTQYNLSDVDTSPTYWRTFRKALDDMESEEQVINNIYQFINHLANTNQNRHSMIYDLIQYVNSNCYDTIYKRYRNEFLSYLQELL